MSVEWADERVWGGHLHALPGAVTTAGKARLGTTNESENGVASTLISGLDVGVHHMDVAGGVTSDHSKRDRWRIVTQTANQSSFDLGNAKTRDSLTVALEDRHNNLLDNDRVQDNALVITDEVDE